MSARVSIEDLEQAAFWCNAYEAEDGDGARDTDAGPYEGTDETAAMIYRVADWLTAEVARRKEDAQVREVVAMMAEDGRVVTAAQARKALRNTRFSA